MSDELQDSLRDRHRIGESSTKDLFAKAASFDAADKVRAMGLYPFFQPIELNEGPEALVDGKRVIMFGSNNYLGLTMRREVREAAANAVHRYGTSLTGSRLLNGTLALHREFEAKLAAFLGKEACIVFTTGYQACVGTLQALVGKGGALALDHRAHASLFDGSRLVEGKTYAFRHGDPKHLDHVLSGIEPDRGVLVVIEGVFSMEGDAVDLPAFVEVAEKHGARILLDDAHGLGVHGPGGRGTAHRYGVQDRIDLIMGTFSKSLASIGGFVTGPKRVLNYIEHFARSFIFTAALPPASLAAASAALDTLIAEPELVDRLQANVALYRQALRDEGFPVAISTTPIIPIVIGEDLKCMKVWRELLDNGLYVNAALAPAVPRDGALLRTSVMATHSEEHIHRAVEILGAVARRHGVLP